MQKTNSIFNLDAEIKTSLHKKGEILQRQGDISTHLFYVKKGLLRSYRVDEKGKEHIFIFASEGWIIADIVSNEFKKPSELYIDCIEDSEILMLDHKDINIDNLTGDQLKQNNHLLVRRIAVLQKRVLMLMSVSAATRYTNFLETYPELPNRVPQHMIASYLGITPQALSAIRKRKFS